MMSSPTSNPQASAYRWPMKTRLRVVLTALLVLGVPVLYLGFLAASGWGLMAGAWHFSQRWLVESGWGLDKLGLSAALIAGLVTWVWFLRPFWLKRRVKGSSLEVLATDQPELFDSIALAAGQVRAPLPVEVRMDCGQTFRLEPMGWSGALLRGRHRLVLGAAWLAVCNKGQVMADLAAGLATSPGGLAGRCFWVLNGVMDWLERAALNAAPKAASADICEVVAGRGFDRKRKKAWWRHPLLGKLKAGYLWLTRMPVWVMLQLTRVVARPALRAVVLAGDAAGARVLGSVEYAELLKRKAGMLESEARVAQQFAEGLEQGRLPDNLPQLRARELERAQGQADAAKLPDGAMRLQRVLSRSQPAMIAGGNSGSSMVRRFFDIARQLTQMHYQQDLGLPLGQFRLVAAAEAAKKSAETDTHQLDIQRYFDGLAHAHRSLCGLAEEGRSSPTLEEMKRQIEASRQSMEERGSQTRSSLKEWELAWQRCRDMEMGHAMALAGMPLDARQYGLTAHDARQYREEINRQEVMMEYSDEALRASEIEMERRLAAALGLLMQAPREGMSVEAQSLAGELPLWGSAYGMLCARLPVLHRLVNRVSAFEALGLSAEEDPMAQDEAEEGQASPRRALRYLLPLIRQDLHQVAAGLETVACPLQPQVSALAWLLEGQNTAALKPEPGLADGFLAMVLSERLLRLHREVFAWLCRAAEVAEKALLPAKEETVVESRRLPELRLGCDFSETGDIAGCATAAAS